MKESDIIRTMMWRKLFVKLRSINTLKYLAAFLAPVILVAFLTPALDNDSWFLLSEGREIAENGIFYTDKLSMHGDFNVVMQQYGFAYVFWMVYSALGPAGIYMMALVLNFFVCFLVYKICMLISEKNVNLSLLIMVITDLMLVCMQFIVTRPQMVSFVLFLAVIYVMELYVRKKKKKVLWLIPVIALLWANMHASLFMLLILLMATYIVDGIRKPKLHLEGYNVKPIVVALFAAILAGLLNPYGIRMLTYIFTSYGVNSIFSLVDEMKPFGIRGAEDAFLFIAIVAVLVLYIFAKNKKRIRARYLLMLFGFLALGISSVRGMAQLILVLFFPIAELYKDVRLERVLDAKIGRDALVVWCGITAVLVAGAAIFTVLPRIKNGPGESICEAVDAIDESVLKLGLEKENLKVYTGYNNGGYLEFRGYKPYLDPRAEVFLKKNNGKEDVLDEWLSYRTVNTEREKFLEKYDFDYVFTEGYDFLYKIDFGGYELIHDDEEAGIRVYRHIKDGD